MSLSIRFMDSHLPSFGKNWLRFLTWGIILVILGLFAIYAAAIATLISVVSLGFIILFCGAVLLLDTTTFWWKKWGGFTLHFIVALLYLIVGVTLISNPVQASISLTLLLGIFYLVIGLFRIGYSISMQAPQWGWALFNGIIAFLLGALILSSWPASSLFIIGLFVGIDLVVVGWTYIMFAIAAHGIAKQVK